MSAVMRSGHLAYQVLIIVVVVRKINSCAINNQQRDHVLMAQEMGTGIVYLL